MVSSLVDWWIGENNRKWWKMRLTRFSYFGFCFSFLLNDTKRKCCTQNHQEPQPSPLRQWFVIFIVYICSMFDVHCMWSLVLQTNKWTEKESIYHHTDEITIVLMFQAMNVKQTREFGLFTQKKYIIEWRSCLIFGCFSFVFVKALHFEYIFLERTTDKSVKMRDFKVNMKRVLERER